MWGQWLGEITGTNSGQIILNIDRDRPLEGLLLVVDEKPENGSFSANPSLEISKSRFQGKLQGFNKVLTQTPNAYEQVSGILSLMSGEIEGKLDGDRISGTWKTNMGTNIPLLKSGEIEGKSNRDRISGTWKTNIGTDGAFSAQKFERGSTLSRHLSQNTKTVRNI